MVWSKRKHKEYQKEYRVKHKNKIRRNCREYYKKNKLELLKSYKIYYRKYWQENRDEINKRHRKYYQKTKGKWHRDYGIENRLRILELAYNRYYQYVKEIKGYINNSARWQKWEDNILKKYYGKIPAYKIQKRYLKNRSIFAISHRVKQLYLKSYIRNYQTQNKILILRNKKNKGKTLEEIYGKDKAEIIREKYRLRMTGENNPAYKDGKSREPYPMSWNNYLRELIRQRDKKCQICYITRNKHQYLFSRDLCVHHIDRNKKNLNPINLIALCQYHHAKICTIQDDLKDHFLVRTMGLYVK